jgi:hypothetical protein
METRIRTVLLPFRCLQVELYVYISSLLKYYNLESVFERRRVGICLSLFVHICIAVGGPINKPERVGIRLSGLTPPYFCACLNL